MGDYPPRVTKSENIYALWEKGEGDMGELAIGLYDLTAHYKALWRPRTSGCSRSSTSLLHGTRATTVHAPGSRRR